MKYYLSLLLFFIFCFLSNSQTYEFNILTNYSISRTSLPNLERNVFSNKLNNSYFLELSEYNDKSKAKIIDLKSKKIHYFEVLETKNKENEKEYNFKHIESKDLSEYSTYPEVYYDYKVIESDSIYKKIELTFYKNKRKKKISSVIELKLKINEFNLFPVFRFSYFHLINLNPDLNIGESGIVESSTTKSEKASINCKLTHLEEVDFKLTVN